MSKRYGKSFIILGAGFGDEAKGLTAAYLSSQNSLTVRFSGGHQAGHTVVTEEGVRHIFSTFGSGALSGQPTYWSQYCTFLPEAVLSEYKELVGKGITPKLYVDCLAPVTTFYDYMLNRFKEKSKGDKNHGSVGVGFGTTIKRTYKSPYTFFVQDLLNLDIARKKLNSIEKYYLNEIKTIVAENPEIPKSFVDDFTVRLDFEKATDIFIEKVKEVLQIIEVVSEKKFFEKCRFNKFVFEGSQGILLDQRFGLVYPHVTMSNTTSQNALEIIKRNDLPEPEIFYITRCYQTRHGNGWMSNEKLPVKLINNQKETNVTDEYQGNFRTGVLDVDMINRAILIDDNFSYGFRKQILISCLDQMEDDKKIPYTVGGVLKEGSVKNILDEINEKFDSVFLCYGDSIDKIRKMNRLDINKKIIEYEKFNPYLEGNNASWL